MNECPTCHRPFGGKQRTCFACSRPILRNHKWHTVGCYMIHDDCSNPELGALIVAPEPIHLSLIANPPMEEMNVPAESTSN